MSEFLNGISGYLSLFALILAIPLAILGNLATPRLEAWWAQRSRRSLERRLDLLERRLKSTKKMLSEPSYALALIAMTMFTAILSILTIMLFLILVLSGSTIALIVFPALRSNFNQYDLNRFLFAIFLSAPLAWVVVYIVFRPVFHFIETAARVVRYEEWSAKMLHEIDQLKTKLSDAESHQSEEDE